MQSYPAQSGQLPTPQLHTTPLRSASPAQPAAFQLSKTCDDCTFPAPLIRIDGASVCACPTCGRVYSYPGFQPLMGV